MIYVQIVDVDEMYAGKEAFDEGDVAPMTASVDNGEGGYVEIYSHKLDRPYRLYSGEYDAFEVLKEKPIAT